MDRKEVQLFRVRLSVFFQALPVSNRLGLNIHALHDHANVHYRVNVHCTVSLKSCFDSGQWLLPTWMHQSEQVSRAFRTDTITVLLRKAVGTVGSLSLWTVPVIGAACTVVRGWTARGLQLLSIYYTWCFRGRALHNLRQHFDTMEPASAAVQASSVHPLLPLSLPEKEREMSQLDSNQRKRKRETEELWRVLSFSLWDHFKGRLAKIAAKGNPVKSM